MRLTISDVHDAAAVIYGPEVAGRLPLVADALALEELVESDQWPALFGGLLLPDLSASRAMTLTHVRLDGPGGGVILDPDEAAAHPLLKGWVQRGFGEALAAPVVAAILAHDAAPGAPKWGDIDLFQTGGGAWGASSLTFGDYAATAYFGSLPPDGAAFYDRRTLAGTHLCALGLSLRRAVAAQSSADIRRLNEERQLLEVPSLWKAIGSFFVCPAPDSPESVH